MVKAVLQRGAIVPTEPLPSDWREGATLAVELLDTPSLDVDAWAAFMDQLCAESTAEDEAVLRRAIEQQRQEAKAQTRRDMGLPE
jgi:hypothetical protein